MRLDETVIAFKNPADQLEKGLEHCRNGDWESGFAHLNAVASQQKEPGKLPSRYYSYLGLGMAIREKRIAEGIKLCRYAVKQEFFQSENYVNLTRIYLLAKRRGAAYKALEKGLEIDPHNPDLLALRESLGHRRPAVLPFLSRSNPINSILGRLRHAFTRTAEKSPARGGSATKKPPPRKASPPRPKSRPATARKPATVSRRS